MVIRVTSYEAATWSPRLDNASAPQSQSTSPRTPPTTGETTTVTASSPTLAIHHNKHPDPCLPVLAIQAHPSHPHLLITSLYDGTIQELYFKRQQSTEIANCQVLFPADAILFSAFDFANHGRELWASDTAGGLVHCNLCQPKSSARCWTASKKKIGCLSICPHFGDRLAVTAGLNQEMR
ncbi:hypothetical protein PtA15_14A231 [Puccinia triticina]|uniref:Anaphase-promoting complex subunit 4 WD40 domain-containing protein n=1 Tax=Puccinia triticina TaxID=208348 RepID=A0ABY7D430_9BASI|nr:uncharacterized protein PtA15_14A231 [Puccinia triticina]WAQ91348.1 hypothetical protein PtA15_14A231 [Puccinia triticina]